MSWKLVTDYKRKQMQNYKKIPLGKGIIDSLIIDIPFNEVEIINQRLISQTQTHYIDIGELEENLQSPKPLFVDKNGIKFRIGLTNYPTINGIELKFVRITLTAKMCKEQYFKGICMETLPKIIETINEHNVIKITEESVLKSNFFDLDICSNFLLETELYKELINLSSLQTLSEKKVLIHRTTPTKLMSKNQNFGISWNNRNSVSISNPFLKLYYKYNELTNNSNQFYQNFIKDNYKDYPNFKHLNRIEATVKNTAAKQHLIKNNLIPKENKFKSFNDLLQLTSNELTQILEFMSNKYFEKMNKQIKKEISFNTRQNLLIRIIKTLINQGQSKEQIIYNLELDLDFNLTKKQRFDLKKEIHQIFDLLEIDIYNQIKSETNTKVWETYCKVFGIKNE